MGHLLLCDGHHYDINFIIIFENVTWIQFLLARYNKKLFSKQRNVMYVMLTIACNPLKRK